MDSQRKKLNAAEPGSAGQMASWKAMVVSKCGSKMRKVAKKARWPEGAVDEEDDESVDAHEAVFFEVHREIVATVLKTMMDRYVDLSEMPSEVSVRERWQKEERKVFVLPGEGPLAKARWLEYSDKLADLVAEDILDFVCGEKFGKTYQQHVRGVRQEEGRAILEKPINQGQPLEVRAQVMRFMTTHMSMYDDGVKAANDLFRVLDPKLSKGMQHSVVELTMREEGADGIAAVATMAEDAAKARPPKIKESKTRTTAATDSAGDQRARGFRTEERRKGPGEKEAVCWNCEQPGHFKGDCPSSGRRGGKKGHLKECPNCLKKGHFARSCPEQVCVGCKEKGHRIGDCKKKAAEEEGNKGNPSKYTEVKGGATAEGVPAAPVLLVEGKADGKKAKIGFDTFAGVGMATRETVQGRKEEWRDTDVQLQGVAEQLVQPLGEVDVQVEIGSAKFMEAVMICDTLPGGADVLVSFDTLESQGLSISKNEVVLGGQRCEVLAAAPTKAKENAGGKEADKAKEVQRQDQPARAAAVAERAARKMLRKTDAEFRHLEAANRIEEVLIAPNGTCEGYRVRAEEAESKKSGKAEIDEEQKRKPKKRKSAAKWEQARKDAKKSKKRAKKEYDQMVWKKMEPTLGRHADQEEARKAVAAVEAERWAKEGRIPVASVCKAIEVIQKNKGKWSKAEMVEALETAEEVPEAVELEEFCVPEVMTAKEKAVFEAEFKEQVLTLVGKSALKSQAARKEYVRVMNKHSGAYCRSLEDFKPGQLDVPELRLTCPGQRIEDPRRQMGMEDHEWFRKETTKFDELGLWSPPTKKMADEGLFMSNAVVVKTTDKESGEMKRRLTVDFWGPNSRIDPPPQHIPTVGELADRVHDAVLFDKDDGISGYYQWKLHEDSKRFTGVYTPLGTRVFNCMPLGINVAPSVWNGAMAEKFGDMPGTRVFTLMDDFVRFTPAKEGVSREELEMDHVKLLDEFLTRVEAMRLKLKLPKAVHAVEEIEALGMKYGHGKMEKTSWTTSAIQEYPVPKTAKQMERFLALGQYYGNFVENYATLVLPLRELQRKKRWDRHDMAEGSKERKLFELVRTELAKELRLALPNWDREFIIKSDFSKDGIGGALLQKDSANKLQAVGFASRRCTPAEGKLSAADGEMAALVWTIKRFEKYVAGRKFTAYVDQGSLSWLKDRALGSINNKRLQHSFAYLRQFKFDLLYLKSEKMADVDALSRMKPTEVAATAGIGREITAFELTKVDEAVVPAGGVAAVDQEGVWGFESEIRDIGELQRVDDEVVAIRGIRAKQNLETMQIVPAARHNINEYKSRDPEFDDFVEGEDGRLYHLETKDGKVVRQLYVPTAMRGRLVVSKHGSGASGHRAAEETLAKLRRTYYWASIRRDVENWISACGCQKKKGEKKQRVGELASLKIARPGEKIVFDIFGPLPPSVKGNVYLLVIMDVGTREMMLEALPTRAAVGVAKALYKRVYLSGRAPKVLQSDLAKEFVSKIVKELIAVLGGKFRHSSPYHPQTNTHVERYNKTLATHLALMIEREDQKDWDEHLGEVEYAQLVGAQRVLGRFSPLFLRGGWEAMDPIDRAMGVDAIEAKNVSVKEWAERLMKARQIAMESQELAVARDAKRYNSKAKELKVDVGDQVWVAFPNVGTGRSKKLAFRLHGPYMLKKWLSDKKRTAELGHVGEENDTITAHVDRIVKINTLPKELVEQWKPLKLNLAGYNEREVEQVESEEDRLEREDKMAKKVDQNLDPVVAEEVQKKLGDPDDPDDGHLIEEIVKHRDSENGREYWVKFVGYGEEKNLWYWEDDLLQTTPEMVAEYEEELERRAKKKINERAPGKRVPGKREGSRRKRSVG